MSFSFRDNLFPETTTACTNSRQFLRVHSSSTYVFVKNAAFSALTAEAVCSTFSPCKLCTVNMYEHTHSLQMSKLGLSCFVHVLGVLTVNEESAPTLEKHVPINLACPSCAIARSQNASSQDNP